MRRLTEIENCRNVVVVVAVAVAIAVAVVVVVVYNTKRYDGVDHGSLFSGPDPTRCVGDPTRPADGPDP